MCPFVAWKRNLPQACCYILACYDDVLNVDFPLHSLDDRLIDIEHRWNAGRVKLNYSVKNIFCCHKSHIYCPEKETGPQR